MNKYLIATLLFLTFSCAKKEQKPFSFVQLCDTQLGMGGYDHDIKSFQQAVKQINDLNADFVVICGDLVNKPNDSSFFDFKKIREGFKIPCYSASGNHDVGNIPNDSSLSYYRNTLGKDYYSFQNKGYSFIVTNTQLWKIDVENESKKHDTWFKETIKELSDQQHPLVVIGHYPLYLETPDEEEIYFNLPPVKRKELLQLFEQNNVIAYLSGHTHKTVSNTYKNIQLLSGETTSLNFDKRPLGFRVWEVSSDTLTHHFVPLHTPIEDKAGDDS